MGSRRETADSNMAPVIKEEIIDYDVSMSKTDQYRKVMKPLIEKKRRARINSCLDELKDLMVFALQTEGESISKLKRQQMLSLNPGLDLDRFHAGFTTCATEVSRSLASSGVAPLTVRVPEQRVPKHLRIASPVSDCGYSSGRDSTPSPQPLLQISPAHSQPSPVWRPF